MKKFTNNLMIKITNELKEKATKKAESKSKNLSEYVRDLIVKDLEN